MSQSRPAAAGFTVPPGLLHEARAHHDVAAQALGEVARAVARVDVPTGRPDTAHACGAPLRQLSLALDVAARSTRSAGVAVGAAGTPYSAAGVRPRGLLPQTPVVRPGPTPRPTHVRWVPTTPSVRAALAPRS